MSKNIAGATFNVDNHLKDLTDKFNRLVRSLGDRNKKGTDRYRFEVEFAYALNEVTNCPVYMQGKMFDKAAAVVNSLISFIKNQE